MKKLYQFSIVVSLILSLSSVRSEASCLSLEPVRALLAEASELVQSSPDPTVLRTKTANILKVLHLHCRKVSPYEHFELFEFLTGELDRMGRQIPTDSEYDVIVIGGGVSGTAVALALGVSHKVLVVEKNQWPSVFGNGGVFYLNLAIDPGISLRNSPFKVHDFTFSERADKGYTNLDSAAVSRNLIFNLFVSGADVALNATASRVSRIENRYEVSMEDGRKFFGNHLVVATGYQGLNLERFSENLSPEVLAELQKREGATIESVESFYLASRKNPKYLEILRTQDVAVIGGGAGAKAVLSSLQGRIPESSISGKFDNHSWSPVALRSNANPGKIHLIVGPKIKLDFANLGKKHENVRLYQEYAKKIEPFPGGGWKVTLDKDEEIYVSRIILATGYSESLGEVLGEMRPGPDYPNLRVVGVAKNSISRSKCSFIGTCDENATKVAVKIRKNDSQFEDLKAASFRKWVEKIHIFETLRPKDEDK